MDQSHGLWRSLVAHVTGGHGVAGSNPVSPTKNPEFLRKFGVFFIRNRAPSNTYPTVKSRMTMILAPIYRPAPSLSEHHRAPRTSRAHRYAMAQNTAHETKLDSLLNIRDLSEYLGVPVETLYDWRLKRTGPTPQRSAGACGIGRACSRCGLNDTPATEAPDVASVTLPGHARQNNDHT